MSLKRDLIILLDNISNLYEFLGENPFKVNAFRNGSNTIRQINEDIETIIKNDSIKNIKGIGKGIYSVIKEYFESGKSTEFELILEKVPITILDIFEVRGLGAKKIKLLYDDLGIKSISELEEACKENKVALLKGFSVKTQEKVLEEIQRLKESKRFIHLHRAIEIAEKIEQSIIASGYVEKIEITGELRRVRAIISSIDFVIIPIDYQKLINYLKSELFPGNEIASEEDTLNIISNNKSYRFYISKSENEFITKLFTSTGNKDFLEKINLYSIEPNYSDENEIFKSVGLPYIIPELRENEVSTIEKIRNKTFRNTDLSLKDFKGLLHFHTVYSDGMNTLEEMVGAGIKMGFEYFAVCDHSKTAAYAGGLTEEKVLMQREEIKKVSSRLNIPILSGIESDILSNGTLDYSDEFIKSFEFVVASIHSQFNLSEDDMTKRMIKAIEHPKTNIIAHPTGRLLLSRDGYSVNLYKIIDACAENKVAIEINSSPYRLDLDWRYLDYALNRGVKFSINPDAHSTEEIIYTKYGIMTARKGALTSENVINCYDYKKFQKFIYK